MLNHGDRIINEPIHSHPEGVIFEVSVTRDYPHSRSLNEWFGFSYGLGRLLTRQNTTGRILMEVSDYYDGFNL